MKYGEEKCNFHIKMSLKLVIIVVICCVVTSEGAHKYTSLDKLTKNLEFPPHIFKETAESEEEVKADLTLVINRLLK
ncbi:CLUMA_CG016969, isoform A [Clunio marinus]|uniref:CLUMA_CG016969, isoform A n=1 Tax=Clunio marinus TaxID=568069 RepID=A0A1J1IWY9_9DIPT|nr:CLUMA_CG016969, isoform A [Clunio marinus]